MQRTETKRPASAFDALGLKQTVAGLVEEIQSLYLADRVPWVVGYSGGKDSTACLQLVWMALAALPAEQRTKTVHVISTDTLVENPVVAAWVTRSLKTMGESATQASIPVTPHRLTPEVSDTFWVNLIGKGYPAPRPKFRWCTERLKIRPSNAFISRVVRQNGEVILVLGTRKAESAARARSMERHERRRVRERLSPNASLPNSLVYSPIEDWSNDDVWMFLMQYPNPWGYRNKDLLTMYQGASADGECPLVVDSSTPSCGDSRFGCWVCTLVDQDKSMQAMIQNDEEKEWMLPLLQLRNELDLTNDRSLRDFRRMSGTLMLHNDQLVHGPYKQEIRERWLRRVLEAQQLVRRNGPEHVRNIELITFEELEEIRRLWVIDKHEVEDSLPRIYAEVTGTAYAGRPLDDGFTFTAEEIALLREVCGQDELRFQLARELLDIERRHRSMVKRSGLFDALQQAIKKSFYTDAEDAERYAKDRQKARDPIQALREPPPPPRAQEALAPQLPRARAPTAQAAPRGIRRGCTGSGRLMVLEELVLHNFGLYRERQTVDLAPRTPTRPIILFGGLNGSGKTTLLDAIKLVLYGKLADCSNRRELSYDEFLRRSIHRAAAPEEGATLELRFSHTTQGERRTYRVIRSWRATQRAVRESVEVLVEGKKDPVLTENWADQVEGFIPARLSRFFFFDGEQVETLADFDRASDVLATALKSLLGLDLVDQLQTDLKVVVTRGRKDQGSKAEREELETAEAELGGLEALCSKAAQNLGSIQNRVESRQKRVQELEAQFRESGGELFLKRAQLEAERRTLESRLGNARDRLKELANGAAPLLLVRDLLDEVAAQAASPLTRLKEQLLTVLDERDTLLLAEARRAGTAPEVLAQLEAFLQQDREHRRPARPPSPALKLTDEAYQLLEGLRGSQLAEVQATASLLMSEVASLSQELTGIERQLALVPDEESVKGLSRKLDKGRHELAQAEVERQVAEEALQVLRQDLARKREQLAKRLEVNVEEHLRHKEVSRIIEHAQGVSTLMEQFRTRVIERHIYRIEQFILEGFSRLARKESLVSRLTIDPATYNLTLFGSDGKPLSPERLSAGERQLLAIAMLWGLARAAGRPLPLVIDTPLGRLDSLHRKNLIEHYFPFASHQVLLLSTDKEIDEGGLDKLRNSVGHSYRIVFDKREGATRIEKGYFW